MKYRIKHYIIDMTLIILGTSIYGFGVHMFTAPNHIAPGGVAGISTIVSHLTGFQIGRLYLLINIPLLILALVFLKKEFVIKTIVSILFFTFVVDEVYKWLPSNVSEMLQYEGDHLLAAIFGGLLIGTGLALTFMRDGSTGGTDITNRIIQLKVPYIKLGKIIFATDFLIIIFAVIGFGSLESGLYAIVTIAVSTFVMDHLLYGFDKGKVMMIVTSMPSLISDEIMDTLKRGCTMWDATGAYTKEKRNVLMCAVRRNEFYKLRKIVYNIDPDAFVMINEAGEVFGKGFKANSEKN